MLTCRQLYADMLTTLQYDHDLPTATICKDEEKFYQFCINKYQTVEHCIQFTGKYKTVAVAINE